MKPFLVVGAGFAGTVVAERLASAGWPVVIIDQRSHIGGNAYDFVDDAGVLVHRYGPHIFHTNARRIFDYLGRFTEWRDYEHRVLSCSGGRLYPFPINRTTLNLFHGLELDEAGAERLLARLRRPVENIRNSEELILDAVGEELYRAFYYNYTLKQWGMPPSALSLRVAARIPVRTNDDDRYFTDTYQSMPREGYTRMFSRMLDHPLIRVEPGRTFVRREWQGRVRHTIFTGPIDAYFDYCLGALPYRSLRFEFEHLPAVERYQAVGTVNYPNDHDFTRITEFRHLTGQAGAGTSIVREYPEAEGDPYYPVPTETNFALYDAYAALATKESEVTFVGRLAQYRYYNMDQAVAAALAAAERLSGSSD